MSASGSRGSASDLSDQRSADTERRVRWTDRMLLNLAARTAARVDWRALAPSKRRRGPRAYWPARAQVERVSVSRAGPVVSVVASALVPCSVAELRAVIRPADSIGYAATMREMFGADFVYGAIAHHISRRETETEPPSALEQAIAGKISGDRGDQGGVRVAPEPADAVVKTITFAQRHFLALSEQWCVLDAEHELQIEGKSAGFAVTMTSLHPDDVFTGKTHASTVSALTDVIGAYTVVPEDKRPTARDADTLAAQHVRITFQVQGNVRELVQRDSSGLSLLQQGLNEKAVIRRLKELAYGTVRLADVVPARRLNAQVFVDPRALATVVPPSAKTRCACCTKRFPSAARRKQCHLCGFFVCSQCSTVHELQRARVRRYLVRVCNHCGDLVDDCSVDNLPSGGAINVASIVEDKQNAAPAARRLQRILSAELAMEKTPPERKQAVKLVIRSLLSHREEAKEAISSPLPSLIDSSSDAEYLKCLELYGSSCQDPPLSSCKLAGSQSRDYPLLYELKGKDVSPREKVPHAPPAPDEEERIKWLDLMATSLDRLMKTPKLQLICELACKIIGCHLSMITTVTRDRMHVLATNDSNYHGASYPREHSFTTHTIITPKLPMLVPHPEADVRYNRQEAVRGVHALRFYFGFPVSAPGRRDSDGKFVDGPVVGTLSCLNRESLSVSRAQYVALSKLTRVIEHFFELLPDNLEGSEP